MSAARLPVLALAMVAATGIASAQNSGELRPGDRFLAAWAGASFYSPAAVRFGHTPNRDLFLAAARAEWILESAGSFALAATADLIPLAIVTNNPTYRREPYPPFATQAGTFKRQTGSAPVYGAGLSPLGLELYGPRARGARVYLAAAVGGLWFTRETPVPDARRFNFTFEYGGGVRVPMRSRGALMVGYKFHHLSNAYTAPRNPGLDGNVFYVGVARRR